MTGTPNLERLVARARRRMRVNRALATLGPSLVAGAAVVAVWAVVSRLVLLPELDRLVVAGAGVAVATAVAAAAMVRIRPLWAAWAADRWLGSDDRYATAVELTGRDRLHELGRHQVREAEAAARGVERFPSGPNLPRRWLSLGLVAALVAAGAAAAPNPKDHERTQRALEQQQLAAAGDELREVAEELRSPGDPARQALADRLERLAEQLDDAGLEEAVAALADARAELARELDDDLAARRTALSGLAAELGRAPLGTGETVRSQLDGLATRLRTGAVGADEQAALAGRLQELGQALAGGQPELADALRQAADALAGGDPAGAAGALSNASGAVAQALAHLQGQAATGTAEAAVGQALTQLREAAAGHGEGAGEGPGQGGGRGEGEGQGAGEGQGSGQGGQGGQTAGGGGGATGPIGGSGQQGGQGGANPGTTLDQGGQHSDLDLETVYDPPEATEGDGDDVQLGGRDSGVGDETVVGRAPGAGELNDALVPYREVLAEYRRRASRSIERAGYPTELRDLVRNYFDRLSTSDGANP